MKTTLLTLALILVSTIIIGQKGKRFKSEDEMKAVHPDSVYIVELKDYQGESLPEWLFKYKNLETLEIIGTSEKPIPLSDLSGVSKFVNLRYLDVSFSSIAVISSELAMSKIKTLIVSGLKINTLRPVYEAMVNSNGEVYIRRIDGFDKVNITDKEELKLFNKISDDGGYFWVVINGKSVKLRGYIFDYYDVKGNIDKIKEYLNN